MNARLPSGTALARALTQAPAPEVLPLDEHVPRPQPRFGKADVIRATLLAMHGDKSRLVKDATLWYVEAKKLGVKIQTRRDGDMVRVWRTR